MSCCCTNTLKIGCIGTCAGDFISTGNNALTGGIFTLHLNFLGGVYNVHAVINTGEEIKFPAKDLNENYTYEGNITDPSGANVTLLSGGDGIDYDCIAFETKPAFELTDAEIS